MARVLIALENGVLTKFSGRNLSACSIDELPIPTIEPEEENAISIDNWAVPDSDGEDNNSEYSNHQSEVVTIRRNHMKRTLTEKDISNNDNLPVKAKKIHQRKNGSQKKKQTL